MLDKGKETDSEPVVQAEFDIGLIASDLESVHQLSNETKVGYLKNHFVPGPKFKFSSETVVKGKNKKAKTLTLNIDLPVFMVRGV